MICSGSPHWQNKHPPSLTTCILNNQRQGTTEAPSQRQIHTGSQTRTLDSHRRLRHWLNPSDLIAFQPLSSSRAKRKLHGAAVVHVSLDLCTFYRGFLLFCSLQFIGEHHSATGQDQVIVFETNDQVSTKDWKAASLAAALG
jgi:hypothetical protein